MDFEQYYHDILNKVLDAMEIADDGEGGMILIRDEETRDLLQALSLSRETGDVVELPRRCPAE